MEDWPDKNKVEISPVTEEDLVELRKHPPTKDDLTNFEMECGQKSGGAKIHKIPNLINALRMILYSGQRNGWSDEALKDFEEAKRAARVILRDPTKYTE